MKNLKIGSRGKSVEAVQGRLAELGLYSAGVDGRFGRLTRRAVMAFQQSRGLLVDGIVGPQTWTALGLGDQVEREVEPVLEGADTCPDNIWDRFQAFVDVMTDTPVVYGPGRGLFVDGQWVVSWGPTALGRKGWSIRPGKKKGPSLHCSSLTNLLLGFLLDYNQRWTHAGNRPTLERLATGDSGLHDQPRGGGARWRGYGEHMLRLASDGDTRERKGLRFRNPEKYLDAEEISARRSELATFNFFSQSDRKQGRWNVDHHTGLIIHRKDDGSLWRLAADGYRKRSAPSWYSGDPVSYRRLPADWAKEKNRVYQIFRLIPLATEGDPRPMVVED